MLMSRMTYFAVLTVTSGLNVAFAASPPSLTSGQIITPTMNAGNPKSLPVLKVGISAPGGIEDCGFTLTSPAGVDYIFAGCFEPPGVLTGTFLAYAGPLFSGTSASGGAGSGFYVVNQPSTYLQGGTYTLTAAQITDYSGKTTNYTASQLAAIFSRTTLSVVNNGKPDYTPPVAVSVQINTPVVHVSKANAYAKVTVKVTDDHSGARLVSLTAVDPSVAGAGINLAGASGVPTTDGNITAFSVLPSNTPLGTYYILELFLEDAAGNTVGYSSGSSIFGGKITFQVKN